VKLAVFGEDYGSVLLRAQFWPTRGAQVRLVTAQVELLYTQVRKRKWTLVRFIFPQEYIAYIMCKESAKEI